MKYETIDSIVRSSLADNGYNTLHRYIQYLHWALRGLKEWNMDEAQDVRTVKLQMDNKKAVQFPDDCLGVSKIGVKVGDRIDLFVPDNSITFHHDLSDMITQPNDPYASVVALDFLNNESSVNLAGPFNTYGFNHNRVGYFRIDFLNREIQFSSEVNTSYVIMEYLTSGFQYKSESVVNPVASNVIREFLRYSEARYSLGDAARETKERKQIYLEEIDLVRARMSDLSLEGILDANQRYFTQTVKV